MTKKISFLGLGAMGSRMAANLLKEGHEVTVWNRSASRTEELKSQGASVAETPASAVANCDIAISMIRDDQASKDVWLDEAQGALNSLPEAAIALECSTLSIPFVTELHSAFSEKGRQLLDAPLAGSRPQAEAAQLIFFVGGKKENFDSVSDVLSQLGGKVNYCGEANSGMVLKLMVNSLFGIQLATVAELTEFAKKNNVDESIAAEVIGATPVCSPAANISFQAMLGGKFNPAFPIDLVAKDFDLVMKSAASVGASIPMSDAGEQVYKTACYKGFAEDNITGIVQSYRS